MKLPPGSRLRLLRQAGKDKRSRRLWLCRCRCGEIRTVREDNLKNGNTLSCGCLRQKED